MNKLVLIFVHTKHPVGVVSLSVKKYCHGDTDT